MCQQHYLNKLSEHKYTQESTPSIILGTLSQAYGTVLLRIRTLGNHGAYQAE